MKEVKVCMIGFVEFTTIYEDPLLMIPTISQIIQVLKDSLFNTADMGTDNLDCLAGENQGTNHYLNPQ